MPIVTTPHVDGTAMSWVDIEANLAAIRTWANDVPVADLLAGTIARESLVRPVIAGFPLSAYQSDFQRTFWQQLGMDEPDAVIPTEWGGRVRRLSIRPINLKGQDGLFRTAISRTVYFPVSTDIDLHATFEVQIRNAANDPVYPDGAGTFGNEATAGYFSWHVYNRATQAETEFLTGLQRLNPIESAAATAQPEHLDQCLVSYVGALVAGTYDFTLVYHREDCPDSVDQIDLSRIGVVGEAF